MFRHKTAQERVREWPQFACDIPEHFDCDADLFFNFTVCCLLQRLAWLHKTGNDAVHTCRKMRGPGEQDLVAFLDQDDDRRGDPGIGDQVAVGT